MRLCLHRRYRRVILHHHGSESSTQSAHDECARCGHERRPYKNDDRRVRTIVERWRDDEGEWYDWSPERPI